MKKFFCFCIFCAALSLVCLQAQTANAAMEITFSLSRQFGTSSNQFAVWIEDSRGNFIKTLYATRFTASGGWQRRPLSIPLWVKQSGLSALNKADIDAFTAATPRSGALSYRWDGTDKNGRVVSPGEYLVFLEATLRSENHVLYSAPFTLRGAGSGSSAEATVKTVYSGSGTREHDMIQNVKVVYRP